MANVRPTVQIKQVNIGSHAAGRQVALVGSFSKDAGAAQVPLSASPESPESPGVRVRCKKNKEKKQKQRHTKDSGHSKEVVKKKKNKKKKKDKKQKRDKKEAKKKEKKTDEKVPVPVLAIEDEDGEAWTAS